MLIHYVLPSVHRSYNRNRLRHPTPLTRFRRRYGYTGNHHLKNFSYRAVNEDGQLVDETDTVFEIAETEKGQELAEKVGEKVTVKGTVAEADGTKTITVMDFEMAE